jgi:hypothetical protein
MRRNTQKEMRTIKGISGRKFHFASMISNPKKKLKSARNHIKMHQSASFAGTFIKKRAKPNELNHVRFSSCCVVAGWLFGPMTRLHAALPRWAATTTD